MKKLFLAMAAFAALFTSCSKDDTFGGPTRGKVTFEVSTPELATRAYGDGTTADNLYYAVYDVIENTTVKTNYATTDTTDDDVTFGSDLKATVTIDLVEGRPYEVAFWAESENSPYTFDADDKIVSYDPNVTTLTANNENYDAFFAYVPEDKVKVGQVVNVDLKRPFAQINIATNDTDKAKEPLGVEVENTAVTVAGVYTSFNLATGEVEGQPATVTFASAPQIPANETIEGLTGYDLLSTNYVLVNSEKLVDVTFNFSDTNGKTDYERSYTSVPVQRNYRTNIIGSILTDPTKFDVEIKPGVDGTYDEERNNRRVVSNAQSLQEAINDPDVDVIVLGNDIDLNELLGLNAQNSLSSNAVTRAGEVNSLNIPEGKTFTLDLNGHTLSATESATGSYGLININPGAELTINDSKGNGAIKLTATNNRNWNAYSSVISNQRGKLTVNGGTIEHLGGTDMAYAIDNLTNTGDQKAETVINGGTVKSTYRAIRQFLNSTVAENNLTVNGGTIEGANKSIWMQNANENLNPGTLVVEEQAAIKGNVYISYSNAANDYISASVAAEALKDGSEVLLSNAPAGYAVKNIDGVWTVTKAASAAAFLEAVAAVEDGGTVTLESDIIFTEGAYSNNGGYKDGLYYVGDKNFTIDLNGNTICQDGILDDYLLNFKNVGSKANTITIKNGTLDAGTTAFCALCTSSTQENQLTINLENVTLYNNISNGSTAKIRGGAILNVKAGTKIIGKDSYLGIESWKSTVNIYDGAEIYMNGTSSYNGCLVGVGGNGTINVYGGYGKGVKGGFIAMTSGGTINVSGGEWIANTDGTIGDNSNVYVLTAQNNKNESGYAGASIINVTGGTFRGGMDAWILSDVKVEKAELNISGGNFNADPSGYLAAGYIAVDQTDGTYKVEPIIKEGVSEIELGDAHPYATIVVDGDITIKGDTKVKTITSTTGGTITIEDGKTLTLTNFSFGSGSNPGQTYRIEGGTVKANYGFFQHGTYELHSDFETGYMYYSYGSNITVYGTFHSKGAGDGLDYVRGNLTIAAGGKSIHDKSLWVGQPESWGAMTASLIIEDGGYVQANSLSVYEGSSLTYYNDADLKYNSLTGTITKAE